MYNPYFFLTQKRIFVKLPYGIINNTQDLAKSSPLKFEKKCISSDKTPLLPTFDTTMSEHLS